MWCLCEKFGKNWCSFLKCCCEFQSFQLLLTIIIGVTFVSCSYFVVEQSSLCLLYAFFMLLSQWKNLVETRHCTKTKNIFTFPARRSSSTAFCLFLFCCFFFYSESALSWWRVEWEVVWRWVRVCMWGGGFASWPLASFLLILRRASVLGALIRVCLLGLHLCRCHAN